VGFTFYRHCKILFVILPKLKISMGRIVAIDYGNKHIGLAATDNLQMIANAIGTVHAKDVFDFLKSYCEKESVECFVVGLPKQMDGTDSQSEVFIKPFINRLHKLFPLIPIERYDERFTSKMALSTMVQAGLKKKDRQDKSKLDSISATIILQSFMEYKQHKL